MTQDLRLQGRGIPTRDPRPFCFPQRTAAVMSQHHNSTSGTRTTRTTGTTTSTTGTTKRNGSTTRTTNHTTPGHKEVTGSES